MFDITKIFGVYAVIMAVSNKGAYAEKEVAETLGTLDLHGVRVGASLPGVGVGAILPGVGVGAILPGYASYAGYNSGVGMGAPYYAAYNAYNSYNGGLGGGAPGVVGAGNGNPAGASASATASASANAGGGGSYRKLRSAV